MGVYRDKAQATVTGSYQFNGSSQPPPTYTWTTVNNQMASVGHRNIPPRPGGPWLSQKQEDIRSIADVNVTGLRRRYTGQVVLHGMGSTPSGPALNMPRERSNGELNAFGTTAIAQSEPTASEWSVAQALAELRRDGLPAVFGASYKNEIKARRGLGSEYLNYDFGWKPLISDFKSFMKAVEDADSIMSQYRRDSGKPVRRRVTPAPTQEVSVSEAMTFTPQPNPGSTVGFAQGFRTVNTTDAIWFSGAFVYHLPDGNAGNKLSEYALMARRLHGVEITPEVIWNVSPWTWAMDWFGNFGDVMHNVSALGRDGLVMKHGYVMHTRSRVERWEASIIKTGHHLSRIQRHVVKLRKAATPYGFDVSWDGLSAKQLATIAALGLSIPK